MIRLRYMSIRPVPNITVYNHPSYPKLQPSEEVRKLPVPRVGVIFKESAPLLEKVEERVEKEAEIESVEEKASMEDKEEVTPTQQVTA